MIDYINAIVGDFPKKLKPNYTNQDPATGYLFAVGDSEDMSKYKALEFHIFFENAVCLQNNTS